MASRTRVANPGRRSFLWRLIGMTEIIVFLAFLVAALPVTATGAETTETPVPTLTTDKADYAPGEVVKITLSGFAPAAQFAVPVLRPNGSIVEIDPVTHLAVDGWAVVTTSADGSYTYEYQLNGIQGSYEARAYAAPWTGVWDEIPVASVTFTDGAVDWQQCQNDSNNDGIMEDCSWTYGSLGYNNSIYTEGQVVPHRQLRLIDTAGSHWVEFGHSFYDAAKDAYTYDFFASPDATLGSFLQPCMEIPTTGAWDPYFGGTRNTCNTLLSAKTAVPIPTESLFPPSTTPYPFVKGAEDDAAIDGVSRDLWISCGAYDANGVFQTGQCSNVQIQILGHGDKNGVLSTNQVGPPTKDDFVMVKVSFDTLKPNTLVAIWVGAHLAKEFYWANVSNPAYVGKGASSSAGASFHVYLVDTDDKVGSRDNQMQADAVVPPAIKTGVKFNDLNADGIKDTTEPGLAGWTIYVDYDNDGQLDAALEPSAVTAADGSYTLRLIKTGTWRVREVPQPGWTCSYPTTSDTHGCYHEEDFLGGNTYPGNDFGNYQQTNLAVTKTAATSLTRTYSWTIDKQADGEYWKFIGDPVTTHSYTVKVQKTTTDSNWAVSGEIKVKNNNGFAVTVTGVTDKITPGDITAAVSCPVTFPSSLAAGAELKCTYSASLPDATTRTNTATVTTTGLGGGGSGTASVDFTSPTINTVGYDSVNVTDSNGQSWGPVSATTTWPYTKDFSCPTNPSLYVNGVYTPAHAVNTATITETGASDTATVKLHCYAPVVSKGADGAYARTYDWTISKGPDGTYNRFAGESVTHSYTVSVDQTATDTPYLVTGDITVTNPNPKAAMTVAVADAIPGATSVELSCGGSLTVPAGSSAKCGYTATLATATAGTNTATVTLNAFGFTATKNFTFTETTNGSSSISVTDTNGKTWTADKDDQWSYDKTFTCPSDPALYAGDGMYDIVHLNTASIDGMTGKSDDATVTVHCYAPVVSKTAAGAYDEVHEWTVEKKAAAPQKKFAGESASYDWIVTVGETVHNEGFVVKGEITVVNPAPMEMEVTLSDMLGDGTAGTLGACTGGTLTGSTLVVPANGTAKCGYSVAPTSKVAVTNWAKAVLNKIVFEASAEFTWTANPVNPTVTLDDSQNPAWPIEVSDGQSFPYADPEGYTCPTDPAAYAGDGIAPVYTDSNTATITYVGGSQSSTASTSVTCYGPIVSKDATTKWMKQYDWKITKTADPSKHSGFAGDTFTSNYDVFVDQTITDYGFVVSGTITIVNPAGSPGNMTLGLTDFVSGGFGAAVDCDAVADGLQTSVVVPTGETRTCSYEAALPNNTSRVNTATGTFNSIQFPATANVVFGDPVIKGYPMINVTDSVQGALGSASEDKHFTYSQGFSCSVNPADYTAYADSDTYPNTATITETGAFKDASVTVDCYIPDVSKMAAGTYGERHEWDVEKTVTPETQNAFAGATVGYTWKVVVTEEVTEENFAVTGTITVVNHNPEDAMTVLVSDVVDHALVTITECSGDAYLGDGLTVAADETSVCKYSGKVDVPDFKSAPKTNTATVVLNEIVYSATAEIEWTPSVTRASAEVTDELIGLKETITDGDTFTGPGSYTCSTNPSEYAGDGSYTFTESNTAIVTSGGAEEDRDSATETINCYGPVVSKTAAGTYDERHEWDVEKTVDPAAQSGFAGDTLPFTWTVTVTESVFEENFDAAGTITVQNPAPMVMRVGLTDVLSDSTAVVIGACTNGAAYAGGILTIPANTTTVCGYTASDLLYTDDAAAPTENTATATLNGIQFVASHSIEWAANVIRGEAELTDLQGPLKETITGSGTWPIKDSYTCSTVPGSYTNGSYTYDESNAATVKSGDKSDSSDAATSITCYSPVVTKTAQTYWNRDWDWTITKDYDGTYNLFAGDAIIHGYKVAVDPTYTDNFWGVKGTITVFNNHPTEDMELTSLTDLAGGINGNATCDSLVVPAGDSLTCSYDTGKQDSPNVNPFGDTNTATAVFAGADWTGTYPIVFSPNPTTENEPIITVDDNNLDDETWSAARVAESWDYSMSFGCPTEESVYDNGKFIYSHTNTATINETGQKDTATVDVTCYWPTVDIEKTGNTLSKIGDQVTYYITIENTTPDVGLRPLSCDISDPGIGVNVTDVELASGELYTVTKTMKIPSGASDPFVSTATVTCVPIGTTLPIIGSTTEGVYSASLETNLFQPEVEIVKSGPATAVSGQVITYSFTINNKSSSDSPNLMLDTVTDNILGDLKSAATAAGCDDLVAGASCTFTKTYTVPVMSTVPMSITNIVTLHMHPKGFPNDIKDDDTHTVTIAPKVQLTDTSYCPLPSNQFRLLYRMETTNSWLLNGTNPGQFYLNGFYLGTPGTDFIMTLNVPYPFVTQEGAGVPIQVHDGTGVTSGGCYSPYPMLNGYTIATQALTPTSSSGNQIITPEDYSTKQLGEYTTVTVSGKVPASGLVYVTIHLDYGLKKTGSWKTFLVNNATSRTTNPVNGIVYPDVRNDTGFGSGAVIIHGYEEYMFSRTVGGDTATTKPSSYNELKKFAGFIGETFSAATEDPIANVKVMIYDPKGVLLATVYTDADGYYLFPYKHTAKAATYTVKLPNYGRSVPVLVKANGFAAVDFEI